MSKPKTPRPFKQKKSTRGRKPHPATNSSPRPFKQKKSTRGCKPQPATNSSSDAVRKTRFLCRKPLLQEHGSSKTELSTVAGATVKIFNEKILQKTLENALKNKYMETLELRFCRWKFDAWKVISSSDKVIDELKLDYTDLRDKIEGLPTCIFDAQVRKLSLISTKLRTKDLKSFYEELKDYKSEGIKLHTLNLMYVKIDPAGCKVLAQILNLMPKVEELNIANCGLSKDAIESLYETISDEKVIHRLCIGENNEITREGMSVVGKLAKKCKVEEIELVSCYLKDEHLTRLSETVPGNIKVLDISKNIDLSLDDILDLGKKWNSLENMNLSECWFRPKDVQTLRKEFPNCTIDAAEHKDEVLMSTRMKCSNSEESPQFASLTEKDQPFQTNQR